MIRPENRFPFSLSRAFSNFSFCRSSQGNNLSLSGDTALGVGDLDTESLGLGEDVDTLAGRDGVSDPTFHISIEICCVAHQRWTYSAA